MTKVCTCLTGPGQVLGPDGHLFGCPRRDPKIPRCCSAEVEVNAAIRSVTCGLPVNDAGYCMQGHLYSDHLDDLNRVAKLVIDRLKVDNEIKQLHAVELLGPVDDVVSELEKLLARAKAGEVRSLAYSVINRDGSASRCHAGKADTFKTLGALKFLEQMILDSLKND